MSEAATEPPLGEIATRVILENDRVRIWELLLEPGEETAAHQHLLDHIIIPIEGDRMASVPHPRSTGIAAQYFEGDIAPGACYYQERGGIETARNVGATRFREILIELKD